MNAVEYAFDIKNIAKSLIKESNGDIRVDPVFGGGNNRCYLIATQTKQYFLKHYFKDNNETCNRLHAEYSFASFAWKQGIRCIPEPISYDENHSVGLYEYIYGKKLATKEIKENEIQKAISFLSLINEKKGLEEASNLPIASEACFTIADHIQLVDNRMKRLGDIIINDDIDDEAVKFVNSELLPEWNKLKDSISDRAYAIESIERIISPSDFGFHNALIDHENQIKFLDFEYAGWDDPAKLVGDFFSQPAVPVSMIFFQQFAQTISSWTSDSSTTMNRIITLLPLIRLKWCCIVLNCFVPRFKPRKAFANSVTNEFRLNQIDKAKNILISIRKL